MENKEIRLINLRRLLKEAKTAAALASAANTNPSYISQILSDKSKSSIGNKLARRLETAGEKPKGWLDTLHEETEESFKFSFKQIPLIALEQVAEWYLGSERMLNQSVDAITDDSQLNSEKLFCIEMTGDAMVSTVDIASSICAGDIVIIARDVEPSFGDIVLVKIKQTIKIRQLAKDGDEQILKAFNAQYAIIPFTSSTKIMGVVIEIRRRLKNKTKYSQTKNKIVQEVE